MKLNEENIAALEIAVTQNYIKKATHPQLPLNIYNYTPRTQFESFWVPITRMSRGLVLDDNYDIIIKCPEKFFNFGEDFAADIDLNTARITEKLDGYYISVKLDTDFGLIITSRGSFDNQYVEAAEKFITDEILLKMVPNYTYFCELLQDFPGDEAIILTKHPEPKLVCWAIEDENFNEILPDDECPFPTAKELSLAEAKQYLEQKVEGIVAQDPRTFERVKIKTEYYILHHKLLSDCTKKRAWEVISQGNKIEDLDIPDEFMQQMRTWEAELVLEYEMWWHKIQEADSKTNHLSDKELGLLNDYQELKPFLFLLRKDREQECLNRIWGKIKPRNMV